MEPQINVNQWIGLRGNFTSESPMFYGKISTVSGFDFPWNPSIEQKFFNLLPYIQMLNIGNDGLQEITETIRGISRFASDATRIFSLAVRLKNTELSFLCLLNRKSCASTPWVINYPTASEKIWILWMFLGHAPFQRTDLRRNTACKGSICWGEVGRSCSQHQKIECSSFIITSSFISPT